MFCYPSQYTNAKYLNAEFKKVRKNRWKNWRKKISKRNQHEAHFQLPYTSMLAMAMPEMTRRWSRSRLRKLSFLRAVMRGLWARDSWASWGRLCHTLWGGEGSELWDRSSTRTRVRFTEHREYVQ